MSEALELGYDILEKGGSSVDAVEIVITTLENSPWFNAGRGSVLNAKGVVEMDASIMEGNDRQAGAVAGVTRIKNPIKAARLVMEESPHVLLSGQGAELFAEQGGLTFMDSSYFITPQELKQWKNSNNKGNGYLPPTPANPAEGGTFSKFGTVGAAALDKSGNLAAGTSTGGMMNKQYGRVGDSPIIGAGTYANNKTCAISCTGHGEYFIRGVVAYDVAALVEYKKMDLQEAVDFVVQKKLKEFGGAGGLIAVDANGNMATSFNTPGMFRGTVNQEGQIEILMFKEGPPFTVKVGGNSSLSR